MRAHLWTLYVLIFISSIKEAHAAFQVKNIYTWMEPSPSNRFHFYLDPVDPNTAYRFIEIPFGVQFIVYDLAGKRARSRTNITMYLQDYVNGQGANGYLFTHFDTEARQLRVLGVQGAELVLAKVSTSGTVLLTVMITGSGFPTMGPGMTSGAAVWVGTDVFLLGGTFVSSNGGNKYRLVRIDGDANVIASVTLSSMTAQTCTIFKHPKLNAVWLSYLLYKPNIAMVIASLNIATNQFSQVGTLPYPGGSNSAWGWPYMDSDGRLILYFTNFLPTINSLVGRRYKSFPTSLDVDAEISLNHNAYGRQTDATAGSQYTSYQLNGTSMLAYLRTGATEFESMPLLPANPAIFLLMGIFPAPAGRDAVFVTGAPAANTTFSGTQLQSGKFVVIEVERDENIQENTPAPSLQPTGAALPATSPDSNQLVIVGAVVGAAAVILMAAMFAYLHLRKNRKLAEQGSNLTAMSTSSTATSAYATNHSVQSSWSANSTQMVQRDGIHYFSKTF